MRRATLSGVEFLRRFLQHVLPRGCTKVRYYGLWSRTRRADLERTHQVLDAVPSRSPVTTPRSVPTVREVEPSCPLCHAGTLILIAVLRRHNMRPP
jgi:hypothetical protein